MPRTPDHRNGPLYEEEIRFDELSTDPTDEGYMRYVSGDFRLKDSIGVFNPRDGAALHGRAIFKIDGGLIYDSNGDALIKETA